VNLGRAICAGIATLCLIGVLSHLAIHPLAALFVGSVFTIFAAHDWK